MGPETYVLALRDRSKSNLNLSLGQDIGRCRHVDEEVCNQGSALALAQPLISNRIFIISFFGLPSQLNIINRNE